MSVEQAAPSGSRASWPGSRRPALVSFAAAVAVVAAIVFSTGAGSTVPARHARPAVVPRHERFVRHIPAGKYGYIPSWLPQPKVPVGRVVTATPAKPWLAIQGDTVRVELGAGRALVTAVGPRVTPVAAAHPRTVRCTFVVTFASAAGTVPLRAPAFSVRDELGAVHPLAIATLPRSAPVGRPLNVTMRVALPIGQGRLMWAPGGGRPVVAWDFDVEVN